MLRLRNRNPQPTVFFFKNFAENYHRFAHTIHEKGSAMEGNPKQLLIRQLNTVWVPHPSPRFLREWVEKNVSVFLPEQ
jgi:hypothetical protein